MSLLLSLGSMVTMFLMILGVVLFIGAWSILNKMWLKPKKLERHLKKQGLSGNSYRFWFGDAKELYKMPGKTKSTTISFSHDIVPHIMPFVHNSIKTHGRRSFVWLGPTPRVNIMEPELIKEIMTKPCLFQKPKLNPLTKLFANGLGSLEDEEWERHKKVLNPAFYRENLKNMLPAFTLTCGEMVTKWEKVAGEGSAEVDVWPYLQTMTSDVVFRTAFGSSYEEGRRIYQLQTEQFEHVKQVVHSNYIPGWRFVPTRRNRRMKEIYNEVNSSIRAIINSRMEEMKAGKNHKCDDLLGILLESNTREIRSSGEGRKVGLSIQDVIEECKSFFFSGTETTPKLLVWITILLAKYQNWQQRAREEVLQVFGNKEPDFDGSSRLKIVTMILNEVMRLYPPLISITRVVSKDTELGGVSLPAGVLVFLPAILIHHDSEIWGSDAHEFKPERFAEGVSNATKNQLTFFPFGWGPRICIAQNFILLEAKVTIAKILQRFSFELSPSYAHAPVSILTLQPQHGAHLILHKLQDNA